MKKLQGPSVSGILVVDIGNTSTSLATYRAGRVSRMERVATCGATKAGIEAALARLNPRSIWRGAMVASVVPAADGLWRRALTPRVEGTVAFMGPDTPLGVRVNYPKPSTIGADRLANACGGVARYGVPLIVADFGTAVTFDVVTQKGYEGGIIGPGLPLMFSYLAEKTAKLPRLEMRRVKPGIGKSTEQAMQLGALWGYRGLVREILCELRRLPGLSLARLVATGGHARRVTQGLPGVTVDSNLTLYGLGRAFELTYNRADS